ncbi:MAG TPA: M48 family metallopeptidase [Polyangia bacterium]|jgi:predicted Zn-dependent protease|nr:M48 family metallopeptidase [Polyangia bacterium]
MKRSVVSIWLACTLTPLAALSTSCASTASAYRSAETTAAKLLISNEQESQLGLQVKQELEQKQNVKYLADPVVVNYVREVAGRVLDFAKKDRPDVKWEVNVIDDPKTVNAFATPGGYLYVYTGLLQLADNEAELAGVMGHEAGHVVARHTARQMVNAYGLEAVTSMALGKNPNLLTQLGATVAAKGALLAHSRSDEDEADEYGARYSSQAGYDPHGITAFFEKLKAKEGNTSKILVWLSDHPATAERISRINRYISEKGLGGSDLGQQRFEAVRRRLGGAGGTQGAGAR